MTLKKDFLGKSVVMSGLLEGKADKQYVETMLELKVNPNIENVTFGDLLAYSSKKIKPGLKSASFHRRAIKVVVEIFREHDPENMIQFKKLLPVKEAKVIFS